MFPGSDRKEWKNEKNVSAIKDQKTAQMRIQSQNGNTRRTESSLPPSCKRTQETCSLRTMPDAEVDNALSGPEKSSCMMKLKSEFDAVKQNGKRITARFFTALVSAGEFGSSVKCGIICSRKFDKRAVRRNRARRLLREAFRQVLRELPPLGIILIPRKEILKVKMDDVKILLADTLKKAGFYGS